MNTTLTLATLSLFASVSAHAAVGVRIDAPLVQAEGSRLYVADLESPRAPVGARIRADSTAAAGPRLYDSSAVQQRASIATRIEATLVVADSARTYGAPAAIVMAAPPLQTRDASATLEFGCTEPTCGFVCAVDGGSYGRCADTVSLSSVASGDHSVSVRATSPDGRVQGEPTTVAWTVDRTAPQTYVRPVAKSALGLTCNEGACSFHCTLNGRNITCGRVTAIPTLPPGAYTIQASARDAAGNVDLTPARYSWTVK